MINLSRIKFIDNSLDKIGYLGKAKMRGLILVSMLDAIDGIIMEATDRVILGNMIGPDAVSASVLVSPAFDFGSIFEMLVASGASILYTRAVGNYDRDKSRKILGMASAIALIFGALMSLLSFVGGGLFFASTGAEGHILEYGIEYFFYYRFTFLIMPLYSLLAEILYIDGDSVRIFLSSAALLIGNALLSYLLIPGMGIRGASLGSAIGSVLAFAIVLSHFVCKKYRMIPVFSFDLNALKEMLKIGTTDAVNSGFEFLYGFLLNLFVVRMFGEEYLAVLAVTAFVYEMMSIGAGVNDSMKTMLLSYRGDKDVNAMKSLIIYSIKITVMIGIVFIGVVWLIAPLFPHLYNIDGTGLEAFTVTACRITSLSAMACIFYGVFLEYYLNIGKYRLQLAGNALDTLLIRLLLNVGLGLSFGAMGIWIGEALCTYVCLAIMIFAIYRIYGRESFPFLINNSGKPSLNLSYKAEISDIIKMRDKVEYFLKEHDVPKLAVNLCMFFFEDLSMLISEANEDEKDVHIDVFLRSGKEDLHMVVWSDGKEFDISNPDRIPSGLRPYLVSALVSGFKERKYQLTAGYNRASFIIPYKILIRKANDAS